MKKKGMSLIVTVVIIIGISMGVLAGFDSIKNKSRNALESSYSSSEKTSIITEGLSAYINQETKVDDTYNLPNENGVQQIPEERLLPRLIDNADLLTESEESELLSKLDEVSERQQFDVAIVTVNSLEGKTSTEYADDFYDYNGYGMGEERDGIILLISMENRDWAISTCGFGIKAFTDRGQEYMVDKFKPDLSDGDYADSFNIFADLCDDYITQAKTGEPYDYGNMPTDPFVVFVSFVVALVVSVILAFIIVSTMKNQLKSVAPQSSAVAYTKPGSMHITQNMDLFLYHVVTKTARPKDDGNGSGGSRTHTSSSGSSHGGSSGHF